MSAEKTTIQQLAPHSVELTTNAKGKIQVSVKVYDDDPAKAAEMAIATFQALKTRLGAEMANG